MDVVHIQLAPRREPRIPRIVDTFFQYAPAVDAKLSDRVEDVMATLEHVCTELGTPKTIRANQGSEFVSRDLDPWADANGVALDFSRPGKPTDRGPRHRPAVPMKPRNSNGGDPDKGGQLRTLTLERIERITKEATGKRFSGNDHEPLRHPQSPPAAAQTRRQVVDDRARLPRA